jgi:hypothetical protein
MQEVGDRFHWIGLQANPLLYKIWTLVLH